VVVSPVGDDQQRFLVCLRDTLISWSPTWIASKSAVEPLEREGKLTSILPCPVSAALPGIFILRCGPKDHVLLVSNTSPTAIGSSSLANCEIVCSTLSSNNRKFSFSRPETGRSKGSFTLTGTSTKVVSTRNVERGAACSFGAGFGRGWISTCARNASVPSEKYA
jgi:hypothetical protein